MKGAKKVINVILPFISIGSMILIFGYFYDVGEDLWDEGFIIPADKMKTYNYPLAIREKLAFSFSANKKINLYVLDSTNYDMLISGGDGKPHAIFIAENMTEVSYTLQGFKTDTYYFLLTNPSEYDVDIYVIGTHQTLQYSGLMPIFEIPSFAVPLSATVIVVSIFGGFLFHRWNLQQQRKRLLIEEQAKRAEFEREQLVKGFVKFIDDDGVERWGTPQQVKEWEKEREARIEREQERLREIEEKRKAVLLKETTIIKEIVKVRCRYCGRLYDASLDKCPNCGASK